MQSTDNPSRRQAQPATGTGPASRRRRLRAAVEEGKMTTPPAACRPAAMDGKPVAAACAGAGCQGLAVPSGASDPTDTNAMQEAFLPIWMQELVERDRAS